jgi:hypothetical protein
MTARLVVSVVTVFLGLTGCSLISLKSPERPLSTRDLNARILTRQFSADFSAAVEQCADDIAAKDTDPQVRANTLRWKIIVADQSERAALQLAPMMAVLDTWALAADMKVFFSPGGAGAAVFGAEQADAVALAQHWDQAAQAMAQQLLTPQDFQHYQQFVGDYTSEHPFVNLKFVRPSVVQLWVQRGGADTPLLNSLGTIPEALADTSDRVEMMGRTLPTQAMWRTELALQSSGLSGDDMHAALARLDERLARLSALAAGSPQVVHEAVADVRISMLEVIDRLDAASAATMATLRTERVALSDTISSERAAIVTAADAQRQAIALNVADIGNQLVSSTGKEARRLARELVLLFILLALVVLGLPFAAGYFVGRAAQRRGSRPLP